MITRLAPRMFTASAIFTIEDVALRIYAMIADIRPMYLTCRAILAVAAATPDYTFYRTHRVTTASIYAYGLPKMVPEPNISIKGLALCFGNELPNIPMIRHLRNHGAPPIATILNNLVDVRVRITTARMVDAAIATVLPGDPIITLSPSILIHLVRFGHVGTVQSLFEHIARGSTVDRAGAANLSATDVGDQVIKFYDRYNFLITARNIADVTVLLGLADKLKRRGLWTYLAGIWPETAVRVRAARTSIHAGAAYAAIGWPIGGYGRDTALVDAAVAGNLDVLLGISAGHDLDFDNDIIWRVAARHGHIHILEALAEIGIPADPPYDYLLRWTILGINPVACAWMRLPNNLRDFSAAARSVAMDVATAAPPNA